MESSYIKHRIGAEGLQERMVSRRGSGDDLVPRRVQQL